jgi:hypothetical protein
MLCRFIHKVARNFSESVFIYIIFLAYFYIERSIEFVIKVGAGTEAVGLFESIHLFVYK